AFKQYRESDGQFYFKLQDAQGRLLLQSQAFAAPKVAGQAVAQLKQDPAASLEALRGQWLAGEGVSESEILDALRQFAID
ncbi:MAG: tryptophan--tRNA ligase, partial [Curvibacter sp.]|nr:tryptophan--tRNA ligase [Curvibacter sp.]